MSLIGRLTNIFRNDVARPVQRNVAQPVQRAVQQAPRVNAQALAQALQRNVAQPVERTIAPTAGFIQHNVIQPFARSAVEVPTSITGKTFHPSGFQQAVLGKAPVAPIQQDVRGVYRAIKAGHQNLPGGLPISPSLAAPYAITDALLHAANIVPDVGAATKGLKVAAPALEDTARSLVKNRTLLNEVGAVGKGADKSSSPPAFLAPDKPSTPSKGAVKAGQGSGNPNKGLVRTPAEFDKKVTAKLAPVNPLEGKVGVPVVQPGDAGQAHLNAQFVAEHEQRVGQQAQSELAKLSPNDQNLMKQIQTKGVAKTAPKAENPTQFVKTEKSLRNYYNTRHAYDKSLGIPTPYRQNYLRDLIPQQEKEGEFAATGGNKAPGYIQQKNVPGVTDVAEGLAKDIAGSSFNHAKLTYAKGLEEAFPGQVSRGSPIVGQGGVTQQLVTPYGNELFANKDIAKGINARAPAQASEGALGAYDKVNSLAKYIKLSGGAFHAFTEAGNFAGQQLMSGKLFTEPSSTGKVLRTFLSPKALNKERDALEANGTLDKARLGGLTWTPKEIKGDVNITPTGKVAKYTGIKALHDATFQRELPYIKMKTFEQKTQGLDVHNPQDLQKIRSIAKGVNSEIGGINRAIDGMTPQQAKVASRFLLATDFTEGKIRTVTSALSKGGEEGKLAREVLAGKALIFAGLASAGGAATGEFQGKDPQEIAMEVLGKFLDPSFTAGGNTVSLPATQVSEFTKPFESFFNGSSDKFSGLKHYATARLAAVPSEANQLVNNLDYTGNHIYGKNTKKNGGQPFTPQQTAVNVARGILPIPFGQAAQTAQGKQSLAAGAANVLGLRVAPTPQKTSPSDSTNANDRIKQAFTTPDDKKFLALSDADKKSAVAGTLKNSPISADTARELYKEYQGAKGAFKSAPLFGPGLDDQSKKTLTTYNKLTTQGKKNYLGGHPDAQYQYDLAKYNNNKANNSLTEAQDIKAQKSLAKDKVGASFDKNTRDIYSLSKGDIYNFITTDQNGNAVADQLKSYDDALYKAGIIAKPKFAYGFGTVAKSSGGSSGSSSGRSSSTKIATLKPPKSYTPKKISAPKVGSAKGVKVGFKKPSAPKKPKAIKIA